MKWLAVLLVFAGVVVAGYPLAERAYTWYWQQRLLAEWEEAQPGEWEVSVADEPAAAVEPEAAPPPAPNLEVIGVLTIEKIGLEIPILAGTSSAALRVGAGLFADGAAPGDAGNAVLTAHRAHTYGRLFNRLDELEPGDRIVVTTRADRHLYTVRSREIVRPDEVPLEAPADGGALLTLVTCHPLRSLNPPYRLVVQAELINDAQQQPE